MHVHDSLFKIFTAPLNKASIKYMVTGSVASMVYGEPRLTHDIDIIIFLTDADISKLVELFPETFLLLSQL